MIRPKLKTLLPIAAAALAVFAVGCEDEPVAQNGAPGTPTAVPAAAPPPAAAAPKAMAPGAPEWRYNPVGKRDPFRNYLADLRQSIKNNTQKSNKQPTEEFELAQYKLSGLITGTSQPKAMVEDPKGVGYTLRVGSRLGRNGGRITRISATGIIVVEEYRDPTSGKRIKVPITVRMPTDEIQGIIRN